MSETLLASEHDPPLLLDTHVESFLEHLRAAGYKEGTLRQKQSIAASFAWWTRREQVALGDLNESHIAAFVERSTQRSKAGVADELAILRPFLGHLRAEAGVPLPLDIDTSPAAALERRYVEYLGNERGLSQMSIRVYRPLVRVFLAERVTRSGLADLGALDAKAVRDFLLAGVQGRSSEYTRLLAIALRSFLRFLFFRGETATDLSRSVPTVRKWQQATVPAFLSPEEVDRILAVTDRTTPRGRRDHAILLLLARLGLRAGEVVALELGDIGWRTGEIVVRGKGRILDRLPLLPDVGEAVALYLQKDRGPSASRRVFLRMLGPLVGLAGPVAIGHVVRAALARAGLRPLRRGAAHLFRHSLATTMIRHGASLTEIAEVLRHRSQSTTAIYAKVAFDTLRGVARRWPGTGGAR